MKKLTITLFASIALAASSFAGHEMVSSGKDFKKTEIPPAVLCFGDHELQIDIFGAYVDGNASTHAGPVRDHGWGGGVGINYFFSRNIGIGAEGYWIAADSNRAATTDSGETVFHNIDGSLIFRFPMDEICLAPYVFVGGGVVVDGDQWAVGFAGLGVEYRVIPNKLGLFIDGRFNYYGDRYGHGDQNNYTARAGVRWVF